MNLKQLIKFGIEESSVPVIKNPILRAALEPRSVVHEPRNMAQEPRIGFRYGSSSFDAHTKREEAFKAYKDYKKSYYNSRQRNPIITFREFLPIYAKENFAEGGRIGYYKGKLVTRGPNTGKYKIKFPTNTILSGEYKGTKYGTEIEIENLIKKRDKLAQKNIKLKVGPKKSAELRIQKRDANFKSLVDDIVKSGDLTALKSNIRQRGGKIPNEWIVDFWNPAIKGGKDSKAMKKLSEILGRDPTEILSLHEGRVGKIKEVQKIVDTEKALAAVDPNKKKFLEILNTSDKLDLKTVAKQLKLSQINTNNLINSVYKDIYKNTSLLGKEETNFVRYLPDKKTPLSALLRSMNKIEGVDKIARRTITDLLDKTIGFKAAKKYQNPELYKLFKSRIHEFYKLKDALPEGLILNLDHPLSMKVINQLGTDVRLQKINVSPITQELNMGLKAQFDKVYGKAIKNNNIKAQKAIEKIAHQIELPMTKVGKEVTDPTKFKFIAEDLKSQILSSLENQNKIAKNIKNIKNIDPNLLKAAGMEKYKFNVPEVSVKNIKALNKPVKLGSFPANIDADMFDFRKLPDDVRHFADITKRYAAESPKLLSALKKAKGAGKWTGWALAGEPAFAAPFAEYGYKMGDSPERLWGDATFGLFGETEKEELKKAVGERGYATQQIDNYGSTLQALETKFRELNDQNDPRGEKRQMIENMYEHTRGKYSKAYNMFVDDRGEFDKGKYDQALNNYTAGLVQIDKFKKQKQDERIEKAGGYEGILQEREIRNIKGYAQGGIASLMKKKW